MTSCYWYDNSQMTLQIIASQNKLMNATVQVKFILTVMTYLGHSNNEAVSHIWDEAVNVNAQITVNKKNRKTLAKESVNKI